MNINKNSWHYKLYNFTYDNHLWNYSAPKRTNLCSYVQRIFWITPAILTLSILAGGIILSVVGIIIFICPFMFLCGYLPNFEEGAYVPYKGLFGWLKPYHVLPAILLIPFEYVCWNRYPTSMIIAHSIIGAMILIGGFIFWSYSKSETALLVRACISSKKNKVCPILEFSDKATSDNSN